MFTFMPHIMAKFTKYIVRTFLVENPDTGQKYSFCNSGGEVKISNFKYTSVSAQLTLRLMHPMPSLAQSKLTATSLAQGEKV